MNGYIWAVEVKRHGVWAARFTTHPTREDARFVARVHRGEGVVTRVRKYARAGK